MTKISSIKTLWVLGGVHLLCSLPMASAWVRGPVADCDDEWAYGVPGHSSTSSSGNMDCYAVDTQVCRFFFQQNNTNCREITASYRYYIGGHEWVDGQEQEGDYPELVYAKVDISAKHGDCPTRTDDMEPSSAAGHSCSIQVDGITCDYCGNDPDDFATITQFGCENLPDGARLTTATLPLQLEIGGGYLPLEYDETRCQHPAMLEFLQNNTQLPTMQPSGLLRGTSSPTMAPTFNVNKDENNQNKLKYLNVFPKLELIMPGATQPPPQDAIEALMDRTRSFYLQALPPHLDGLVDFQPTQRSTVVTSNSHHTNFHLNYTAELTFAQESTTNLHQVAAAMASSHMMNRYLYQGVRKSHDVFHQTELVQAKVVANEPHHHHGNQQQQQQQQQAHDEHPVSL